MPEKAQRDWSLMGSSYIAPLICDMLDDSTFLTPIEIYRLMRKEMKVDLSHVKRIQWGSRLESAIIQSVEDDYGLHLSRNITFYHPDKKYFCSTPDGINFENKFLLECKNVDGLFRYKWNGDGETEMQIPRYVYVQTQWHLHIANMQGHDRIDRALIRALFGGNEDKDYWINYDKNFCIEMEDIGEQFIHNYVMTGMPPPIDCSRAYSEYLLSLYPPEVVAPQKDWLVTDDKEIIDLVKHLLSCRDACDIADNALQLAKNKLQNVIGEMYGVKTIEGNVSWYPRKGSVSKSKVLDEILPLAVKDDDMVIFQSLMKELEKSGIDKLTMSELFNYVSNHTFTQDEYESALIKHTGDPTRVLKLPNRK